MMTYLVCSAATTACAMPLNWGTYFDGAIPWETSPYFNWVNRNKLSVTLNLKDPRGIDIIKRLVQGILHGHSHQGRIPIIRTLHKSPQPPRRHRVLQRLIRRRIVRVHKTHPITVNLKNAIMADPAGPIT